MKPRIFLASLDFGDVRWIDVVNDLAVFGLFHLLNAQFATIARNPSLVEHLPATGRIKRRLVEHDSRTFAFNHPRDRALKFVQKRVVVIKALRHN